jgi:hypothetical protein
LTTRKKKPYYYFIAKNFSLILEVKVSLSFGPYCLVINILVQNFAITSFLSYFSYFFKKQIQKQQKIKKNPKTIYIQCICVVLAF